MKKVMFLVMAVAIVASANAAVITVSQTAPTADATDEANLGAETGTLKWFHDIEHDAGQTFTPSENLQLNAFTVRIGKPNEDDAPDRLNFRLGTITRPEGVFTFTDIYAENDVMIGADLLANDFMTITLDEAQERNFVRWPVLGIYVWPNWFIADTHQEEIDWIKWFLATRLDWIDAQFFAPPTFNHAAGEVPLGFQLTMTGFVGSIYYTLDGTDPMLPDGSIAPGAMRAPTAENSHQADHLHHDRDPQRARLCTSPRNHPP